MRVSLVQVPYMLGDERHGAAAGPERYVAAGAEELLAATGHDVYVERVSRHVSGPFPDGPSASAAVNEEVATFVQRAVSANELPLVLAGSCDASLGVLGGFDHAACGVVWIDAHADFNTPDSSVSGFFPGMSLAVVVGHCHRDLWARIGENEPVPEESVLAVGVRELSPDAERARLERSGVQVVAWRAGQPQGELEAAFDRLAMRVRDVYLHIDNDAFDPAVAPGVVDDPVPGGLSMEQMERVVRGTAERFRLRAVTLATYNPERDEKEKTLRAGLRLIELLGEYAA
jgi:arginase